VDDSLHRPPLAPTKRAGFNDLYPITNSANTLFIVRHVLFGAPQYLAIEPVASRSPNLHHHGLAHLIADNDPYQ
jgi:hypothetical protein